VTPESVKAAAKASGMSLEEAQKILGVDRAASLEQVLKVPPARPALGGSATAQETRTRHRRCLLRRHAHQSLRIGGPGPYPPRRVACSHKQRSDCCSAAAPHMRSGPRLKAQRS